MNNLIYELDTLEKLNFSCVKILNNYNVSNKFKETIIRNKINSIVFLANDCLIDNSGYPLYENIDTLKYLGFSVYACEKDRFGWLTAIINTKKGEILFG